jgi:hypothetical protein
MYSVTKRGRKHSILLITAFENAQLFIKLILKTYPRNIKYKEPNKATFY